MSSIAKRKNLYKKDYSTRLWCIVHQQRIQSVLWHTSSDWFSTEPDVFAVPEGVDVIIVDAAEGTLFKAHVAVHEQHILSIFLVSNGIASFFCFSAAIRII
jgi:hypothetical protein